MNVYKCDICGKYVDDCYSNRTDTFDLYLNDLRRLGYKADNKIELRDMCDECYIDIKNYIHNRYKQFHLSGNEVSE